MATRAKNMVIGAGLVISAIFFVLNLTGGGNRAAMSGEHAEWAEIVQTYGLRKDGIPSETQAQEILLGSCTGVSAATYVKLKTYAKTLNFHGNDGRTLLHVCQKGTLWETIADEYLKETKDINPVDARGLTPLLVAVREGNLNQALWLKQHGADINATDENGNNAIFLANEKMYDMVLSWYPLTDDPVNANGQTLLMVAIEYRQKDKITRLMQQAPSLEKQDRFGKTALHYAAQSGDAEITKEIISRNLDLAYIEDRQRQTPIDVATGSATRILSQYTRARRSRYD